jgi:hypothetical protein
MCLKTMKNSLLHSISTNTGSVRNKSCWLAMFLLALTLTACGGGSSSTSPSDGSTASNETASIDTGASSPAEPAVSPEPASSAQPASSVEPASSADTASEAVPASSPDPASSVVPPAKRVPIVTSALLYVAPESSAVNWSPAAWDATITTAKQSGFTSITLPAAVRRLEDGTTVAYYPSTVPGTTTGGYKDILGTLMPILRKHGMHIRIGLFLDLVRGNKWYIECTPAADDPGLTKAIANDIWRQYGSYSELIDGWYLSNEVSSYCSVDGNRVALANYYRDLTSYLHTHHDNMSVMISPYFNVGDMHHGQTPATWTALWTYILNAAPIDIIALQDGAGDKYAPDFDYQAQVDALPVWFAATKTAILQSSHPTTQLWDNLDLYDMYTAGAMSLDRLTQHVAATQNSVSQYTNFGWFSQFAPWVMSNTSRSAPFAHWNLAGQ